MRWPFSRRVRHAVPPLAEQATTLAELATRISAGLGSLRERERALDERAEWLEHAFVRDSRALDARREALDELSATLRVREEAVLGIELRSVLLDEREEDLRAREARLLAEELGLRRRSDDLDVREAVLAERESARTNGAVSESDLDRCLLFLGTGEGYRLLPLETAPPQRGATVELEGRSHVVLKVGPSPLPGDERRCAYLD